MESITILEAKNVFKSFVQGKKTIPVLSDISATFTKGNTYAIIGASGSGKSTFLHLLGGLDQPTKGSIFYNNHHVAAMHPQTKEKILNHRLGFIFQFHYLINELTVLENVMLMGMINGQDKATCKEKAHVLLDHVGLKTKEGMYPWQLSGGEQERVAILRAIFNKPDFLLADEPTGNLDAANAQHIVSLLRQYNKEWQMGIILCSHDKEVYGQMDTIFELHNGELIAR